MAKPNKPPAFTSIEFDFGEHADTGTLVILGADYIRDDRGETFTFTFIDSSGLFSVDSTTGDITFIGDPEDIDFESGITSYSIEITVTDSGGNVVTETVVVNLIDLDETPPATPTLDLDSRFDTGLSDTDNLTSDPLPRLTGTGEAGTTIEIYDDGVLVGTTTVKNNGTWSISFAGGGNAPALSPLAEGDNLITVRAVNEAGVPSGDATLIITVDTAPPAAPVLLSIEDDSGALPDDGGHKRHNVAYHWNSRSRCAN